MGLCREEEAEGDPVSMLAASASSDHRGPFFKGASGRGGGDRIREEEKKDGGRARQTKRATVFPKKGSFKLPSLPLKITLVFNFTALSTSIPSHFSSERVPPIECLQIVKFPPLSSDTISVVLFQPCQSPTAHLMRFDLYLKILKLGQLPVSSWSRRCLWPVRRRTVSWQPAGHIFDGIWGRDPAPSPPRWNVILSSSEMKDLGHGTLISL